MPIDALCDPPFSELAPTGPLSLFSEAEVVRCEQVLDSIAATAAPTEAQSA